MRSSMSSSRAWRRRTSMARDSSVGWSMATVSLIGFLSVFDSIHEDQIALQHEEHPKAAHPEPVFVGPRGELLHVAGKAGLKRIQPPSDVAALLLGQGAQLHAGFAFDLKPVSCRNSTNLSALSV